MYFLLKVLFMLLVLSWSASCEDINNIKILIHTYEENFNTSIALDKNDKMLLNSWAVDFQVKRVNVTTKYRMQMTMHKEHSFRKNYSNAKWTACMNFHKKEIKKIQHTYYENESNCLKTTTDEDKDQKRTVEQVGKEIRKWRKGYKYLLHLCNDENPANEESADTCLVEYMQKDNYNKVIERLILLNLDAIGELYLQMVSAMNNLDECLETNLSDYLESVRRIMDNLNICYNLGTNLLV